MKKKFCKQCGIPTEYWEIYRDLQGVVWFNSVEYVPKAELQAQRENILSQIKGFDITYDMNGKPVENPLMRLNDVKNFLLASLTKE